MDMKQMMRQAQKMQAELAKAQEEIKTMTAEATAGGGMVKVVAQGDMTVQSITIDPAAIDPEDADMLQDMVCAAVNDALSRYVGAHAQRLLSRNECIINMAVVGDRLLLPPVRGADVDFHSLNRFSRSADFIWSLLCQDSPETRNEP